MTYPLDWQKIELENNQNFLERVYVFKNFAEAKEFISKVAVVAEKMNHHPTIINTYNKVTLQLNTHDAKNTITELDIKLSKEIDKIE
jgi:4a-hydroxytetrahydrobiopterin dehydratase